MQPDTGYGTKIIDIDQLNGRAWELRNSEPREAYVLAKQAFERSFAMQYSVGLERSRFSLALIALDLDLHAEAYEHASVAVENYSSAKDEVNEAIMQNVLGGVYYYIGDNTNRLKCNLRGLALCRNANDHEGLLRAMNNTADTYTRMEQYEKAMILFEECLSLAVGNSPNIECIVLSNIGEVHMLQKDYAQSKNHILASQEIGKRVDYREIVIANHIMLAEMALEEGELAEASTILSEALHNVNERISLHDKAQLHRLLSEVYGSTEQHQLALEHHRLFHQLEQQHLDGQKIREVRSIEFKNEMNALENTAQHLEKMVEERTVQLENTLAELQQRDHERQHDLEVEQKVNQFSQSLFLQNTVDEVLWDLAKNCISRLDFEDCVIYMLNDDSTELRQKAAYGPKNPIDLDIHNPITIPVGKGIVGTVAGSGKYELVADTSLDERYIVDDQARLSEIAVPIMSEDRVIGVIDSEHHQKAFFNEKHLHVLQTIATLVANRIDKIRAQASRERLQQELIDQLRLNEQLQTQVTRELEDKVQERTSEIDQARQRIEKQARGIQDSINYASYIQTSLLPTTEEINQCFSQNFIVYQPRDVVSGDFYWVAQKGSRNYLAVADCTGHGVPGALVSVLCIEKMEQALLLFEEPAAILQQVNREVRRALRQQLHIGEFASRDGMDVALICFDSQTNVVQFAGAKRPAYLVRQGELEQLSPTRFSIGGHSTDSLEFEQKTFEVEVGDQLYLFSDGYTDQFGGPKSKRFSSKQLRTLLINVSSKSMKEQQKSLLQSYHDWKGQNEQIDDVLLAGIRF